MEAVKQGFFRRVSDSLQKWFRDSRSEFKKVIWPPYSRVQQNTFIVLVFIAVMVVVICSFDWLWVQLITWLVNRGA